MSVRKCRRCRKRVERLALVDQLVSRLLPKEMARIRTQYWSSSAEDRQGFEPALREVLRNAALRMDP